MADHRALVLALIAVRFVGIPQYPLAHLASAFHNRVTTRSEVVSIGDTKVFEVTRKTRYPLRQLPAMA